MERLSLCPGCTNCPEVVIDVDTVRIGEDDNVVTLKKAEWNVLEVISKLGIEGEGSIAWAHGMASPHRRAVGADSTAAAS